MPSELRYGLATPEQVAGLTGRQILEAIIDGRLPQPPICKALSFWLVETGAGFAAFEGQSGDHLLNPLGTVHGGWALTLIDSATGCAAQSALPAGVRWTTVETKGNFSRAILPDSGRVRAEGRVIAQGRQIISADARITDKDGRVLAHGVSTMLVLGQRQ